MLQGVAADCNSAEATHAWFDSRIAHHLSSLCGYSAARRVARWRKDMTDHSFRFTHAITRAPAASITEGLRAVDIGAPDLALMQAHHAAYVQALRETGATVIELDPLTAFPDSVFVEDTALCLPRGAVVMRPGAPSRLGEAGKMAPHLRAVYSDVRTIAGEDSFIEGGDILTTETEILVGRSARTNAQGVAELAGIVADWGYALREVFTPPGVLHFKTDCSLLDGDTILSTRRLDASGCFSGYRVIHVAEGEEACANTIRFNDVVIMPSGFPRTRDVLDRAGFRIVEIGNSECAKLDGGMSCLSLRFTPT
jgi:dimethylargininase